MARVTVEDCIEKVKNRFELILMAAKRAKDIDKGAQPSVSKDNDKSTIIALREIADETISLSGLRELAKRAMYEEIDPLVDIDHEEENLTDSEIISREMAEEGDREDAYDEDEELDDEDLEALEDLDNALGED